jgi:lipopolysaccharide transport system ATP-binding protein
LQDVSFEVQPGEVVGIIGRNGAGKSTLLKVLSRITEPTAGRVQLRGRIGSLLEVGTGFHPELTGRENIYLNGAILGMTRREIARKFDAIVEFSEIERFIDTPVKRYSSGMYVRLAFAVASQLEPEILVVDEVLAVGDHAFQKKCFEKMKETGRLGYTVLVVTHDMHAVMRLCDRAVLLDAGRIVQDGDAQEVVHSYIHAGASSIAERCWDDPRHAPGDDMVCLKAIRVKGPEGTAEEIDVTEPVQVEMEYWILQPCVRPLPNVHFFNEDGLCLFASTDWYDPEWKDRRLLPGIYRSQCHIPANTFAEGQVSILAALSTFSPVIVHVRERDAVSFRVVDQTGCSARGEWKSNWPGVVRPLLEWTSEQLHDSTQSNNHSNGDKLARS